MQGYSQSNIGTRQEQQDCFSVAAASSSENHWLHGFKALSRAKQFTVLCSACQQLNKALSEYYALYHNDDCYRDLVRSGTTLCSVLAWQTNEKLKAWVSNIGDSSVYMVVVRPTRLLRSTRFFGSMVVKHCQRVNKRHSTNQSKNEEDYGKGALNTEHHRVQQSLRNNRVQGRINVTRCFGDYNCYVNDAGVIVAPDFYEIDYELCPDEVVYFLAASDGLDVVPLADIGAVVAQHIDQPETMLDQLIGSVSKQPNANIDNTTIASFKFSNADKLAGNCAIASIFDGHGLYGSNCAGYLNERYHGLLESTTIAFVTRTPSRPKVNVSEKFDIDYLFGRSKEIMNQSLSTLNEDFKERILLDAYYCPTVSERGAIQMLSIDMYQAAREAKPITLIPKDGLKLQLEALLCEKIQKAKAALLANASEKDDFKRHINDQPTYRASFFGARLRWKSKYHSAKQEAMDRLVKLPSSFEEVTLGMLLRPERYNIHTVIDRYHQALLAGDSERHLTNFVEYAREHKCLPNGQIFKGSG